MNDPLADISIIVAVHDVARYLPEFFGSLADQHGVDLSRVEIVAVDDGSSDDSLAVLHRYAAEHAARGVLRTTVLTKPNGGQATARNLGLDHATGTWVTFTDPDDMVDPHYLARVLGFVAAHPDVELVATNRLMLDDATGEVEDTHALRRMFADGDVLVDLDRAPDRFHGSAPASFVRRDRVEALDLRFDERIRPNFEDGHFCTRYLLACPRPLVGFVASAVYVYRKRADGSSTLQNSVARPERYTHVPRYGFLDVLRTGAAATGGYAPEWVQSFVLYELSWYFSSEDAQGGSATAAVGDVAEEFLGTLAEIVGQLDPDVVASFRVRWLAPAWRQILLHAFAGAPWHSDRAVAEPVDRGQRMVRLVHRFIGPEPAVVYECDGVPTEPVHTKLRTHVYFDRPLLQERISWLPAEGKVRVRLDGRLVELRPWWHGAQQTSIEPLAVKAPRPGLLDVVRSEPSRVVSSARRRTLRRLAASPSARRRYADAWVLMDRIHDADDSAEHLFTYLRENRPDVNAWFVIEAGTPDHARLRRGPHADRVVAHGSTAWSLLMLNCAHLVSSHVDVPVHAPPEILDLLRPGAPQWRFTFLQHGVIKDDLSNWLNVKALDLFVTSTPDEYASIAGDGTPYVFTAKEVRLLGLPRFDRLHAAASKVGTAERDLLLVAPTWRHWLLPPLAKGSQRRRVRDDFADTDYARQWQAFVGSQELAALAREHGLRIAVLPHPNLASALPMLDLPADVEVLSFEGGDVQRLFARAAVLVTDYSSMAFNAAYVDRPVVYFQFDADVVLSGGHVGRKGYFDYERYGFGPVTQTAPDAVAAVEAIVRGGCRPAPEHAGRVARTFVLRDGRCCARVTEAIESLTLPLGGTRPGVLPAAAVAAVAAGSTSAAPAPEAVPVGAASPDAHTEV